MAKKGKGKKGKKKELGPIITTTQIILDEREKMLCPRLGDVYSRTINVEHILEEVVAQTLQKCANKQYDTLNLSNMRLTKIPDEIRASPDLQCITDINLSRNQLFNNNEVFEVMMWMSSCLVS